jgi:hypothetical protein
VSLVAIPDIQLTDLGHSRLARLGVQDGPRQLQVRVTLFAIDWLVTDIYLTRNHDSTMSVGSPTRLLLHGHPIAAHKRRNWAAVCRADHLCIRRPVERGGIDLEIPCEPSVKYVVTERVPLLCSQGSSAQWLASGGDHLLGLRWRAR